MNLHARRKSKLFHIKLLPALLFIALFVKQVAQQKVPKDNRFERLYSFRYTPKIRDYGERYFVAACVLVRDASSILPEFIVRNYLAGIDHFYIYGDDDTGNDAEMTRLHLLLHGFRRIVTYLPNGRLIPEDSENTTSYVQMRIYRHCAAVFGPSTHWMAFIDSDEMFETTELVSIQPKHALRGRHAFLYTVLNNHEDHPVLCIRWRTVLTNGRILPPQPGSTLLDSFPTSCALVVNNTIKLSLRKTILRPALLDLNSTPKLDVALHKGFRLLPPWHRFHCIWGPGSRIAPPLYLAHYWSRSLSEYVQKIGRGRPRNGVPKRTIIDLINRERVCQPDPMEHVLPVRRKAVGSFSDILSSIEPLELDMKTVSEFIQSLNQTEDSILCTERVATLLHQVAHGSTLPSNLHWTIYLTSCSK